MANTSYNSNIELPTKCFLTHLRTLYRIIDESQSVVWQIEQSVVSEANVIDESVKKQTLLYVDKLTYFFNNIKECVKKLIDNPSINHKKVKENILRTKEEAISSIEEFKKENIQDEVYAVQILDGWRVIGKMLKVIFILCNVDNNLHHTPKVGIKWKNEIKFVQRLHDRNENDTIHSEITDIVKNKVERVHKTSSKYLSNVLSSSTIEKFPTELPKLKLHTRKNVWIPNTTYTKSTESTEWVAKRIKSYEDAFHVYTTMTVQKLLHKKFVKEIPSGFVEFSKNYDEFKECLNKPFEGESIHSNNYLDHWTYKYNLLLLLYFHKHFESKGLSQTDFFETNQNIFRFIFYKDYTDFIENHLISNCKKAIVLDKWKKLKLFLEGNFQYAEIESDDEFTKFLNALVKRECSTELFYNLRDFINSINALSTDVPIKKKSSKDFVKMFLLLLLDAPTCETILVDDKPAIETKIYLNPIESTKYDHEVIYFFRQMQNKKVDSNTDNLEDVEDGLTKFPLNYDHSELRSILNLNHESALYFSKVKMNQSSWKSLINFVFDFGSFITIVLNLLVIRMHLHDGNVKWFYMVFLILCGIMKQIISKKFEKYNVLYLPILNEFIILVISCNELVQFFKTKYDDKINFLLNNIVQNATTYGDKKKVFYLNCFLYSLGIIFMVVMQVFWILRYMPQKLYYKVIIMNVIANLILFPLVWFKN